VNEATLYLKNDQSLAIRAPVGQQLQDMLRYLRVPEAAAGKTIRLQALTGEAVDIAANDIGSFEVAPPHAVIPDFLTDAELAQVLAFTTAHADAFQSSGAYEDSRKRMRRSRILDGPGNSVLAAMVFPKLQALMPTLWSQLRMDPLNLRTLECQITAHGDGDFFDLHTDNGAPDIAYRKISYVYYFQREPKQFSGGHLFLYHTLFEQGFGKCGQLAEDINPPRNGMVIFPTSIYHKVTPIKCASSALADQRLTMNGWMF